MPATPAGERVSEQPSRERGGARRREQAVSEREELELQRHRQRQQQPGDRVGELRAGVREERPPGTRPAGSRAAALPGRPRSAGRSAAGRRWNGCRARRARATAASASAKVASTTQRQRRGREDSRRRQVLQSTHAGTGTETSGRRTSNCVPWPALLSTVRSPPCWRTIWNTMASPRPDAARPGPRAARTGDALVAGQAAPLVAHAQHQVAAVPVQPDLQAAASGHRLEAVPHQVPEHLRDLVGIGVADVRARVRLELDHVVGAHLVPVAEQRDRRLDHRQDVDGVAGARRRTGLVEEAVECVRQPLRLARDDVEQPPLLLAERGLGGEHLGRAADRAERVADLVRQLRRHLADRGQLLRWCAPAPPAAGSR